MAGEVVVDALPYFDQGYDEPGIRDAFSVAVSFSKTTLFCSSRLHLHFDGNKIMNIIVQSIAPVKNKSSRKLALALVEEETRRYRPTKNYLEYLASAQYNQFETEIMKTEFERMQSRLPMDMMNMKRYELPQPPAGKMTDFSAWNECVENSQAQLEHQALRILNLDLLQEYGSNAWKSYNETMVKMLEQAQKQLAELKKKIQEINWQRKSEQSEAGGKLKDLENSWVGLVSKNYEIERACVEMEKELAELEKQKKSKR